MNAVLLALTLLGAEESPRRGIWGLGVGLEFPALGVPAALGSQGNVGVGYTFGGAISYEYSPALEFRLGGRWIVVQGATPQLRLDDPTADRTVERQRAQWFDLEGTLGATYYVGAERSPWSPFVGVDVGIGANGYEFFLGEDSLADVADPSTGPSVAHNLGFVAGVRAGVRLELAYWLATLVQLRGGYAHLGEQGVSGTVGARDVRNIAETVWTLLATFSVRVGL